MHCISRGAQEDTQKNKSNKTCINSLRSLKAWSGIAEAAPQTSSDQYRSHWVCVVLWQHYCHSDCSLQYPKLAVTGALNAKVYVSPGQTHRSRDKALCVAGPTGMWDFLHHKNPVIESTSRRWNSLNPCCFENNGEERRTHSNHRGTSNNTEIREWRGNQTKRGG